MPPRDQPTIQIIAPNRREHRDGLIDLWSKVFAFGGMGHYFKGRDFCKQGYLDGSHYDWGASRIGVIDGRIVSHYGVWRYDMRVGRAAVRCGGVGAVSTHPDFRKRGYLMQTGKACLEAMRRQGYGVSLLFGIDDLYDKFGYVRAFSDEQHYVAVDDLPREKPALAARKFKPVRREDTDALYNRAFASATGTAVRPTFKKAGFLRGEGYGWADKRGRLTGYVYVEHADRQRRLKCCEAVGDVDQVLRVLAALARRHGYDGVEFPGHPVRTPLMRRVQAGRCEVVTRRNPNGGPMARIMNLGSTLEAIADELDQRLKVSAMAGWSGTLVVSDRRDKAGLRITRHGIAVGDAVSSKHTIQTRSHAVQLVFGTDEPETLMREARMKTTGDAAALVAAMFPSQAPALLAFDRF